MMGLLRRAFMCGLRKFVLATGILFACPLYAVEILEDTFNFDGKTYSFRYIAALDAPAETVHAVIADHEQLHRINDNIIESRIVKRYSNNRLRRFLRVDRCVLSFCFELHFVEDVEHIGKIVSATIIPEESTFTAGTSRWRADVLSGNRTQLTIKATQTLDLWVPPPLGKALISKIFREELIEMCEHIEQISQASNNQGQQ